MKRTALRIDTNEADYQCRNCGLEVTIDFNANTLTACSDWVAV